MLYVAYIPKGIKICRIERPLIKRTHAQKNKNVILSLLGELFMCLLLLFTFPFILSELNVPVFSVYTLSIMWSCVSLDSTSFDFACFWILYSVICFLFWVSVLFLLNVRLLYSDKLIQIARVHLYCSITFHYVTIPYWYSRIPILLLMNLTF